MLLSIILTAAPAPLESLKHFMAYRKSEKVCPTTVTICQKSFFHSLLNEQWSYNSNICSIVVKNLLLLCDMEVWTETRFWLHLFQRFLKLSRFHHHFLKPTRLQWKPISGFQIQTFSCLSHHTLINPNPFLNCKTSNLMPLCNFKEHASPKGFNVYHKFFR